MAFVIRIFHPWADYCPLKWRAVHAMIRVSPRIIFFLSYLPSASPWNFVSWSLKLVWKPIGLEMVVWFEFFFVLLCRHTGCHS